MECSDSKVGFVRSVEGYIHLLHECVCIAEITIPKIHLHLANTPTITFDEKLESNRDVLERIKEKGD